MKIYFVDKSLLGKDPQRIEEETFSKAGMQIEFMDWKSEDEIIANATDADALMVVAVNISARTMDALPNLKFIGRCGIGYDSVDINAAAERGVVVCNVPDYCTYDVAVHALTLMLTVRRRIMEFTRRAREGGFGPGDYLCHRLQGQKLGLVGYGRIAREFAAMARGIGMQVLVYDPYVKQVNDPDTVLYENLSELISEADVISIHVPLTAETKHMIGREQFEQMKAEAVVVNTSRGPIIDTEALLDAVQSGQIAGAGLDVCEGEPLPGDSPVLHTPGIVITPHCAMYSEEAMCIMHRQLAEQAIDILSGRWTRNVVNPNVRKIKEFADK